MACPYTCVGKNICIYCAFTHRRRTPAAPARRRAQRADRQAPPHRRRDMAHVQTAQAIWQMQSIDGHGMRVHERLYRLDTAASIKAAPQAYTATPMRPRWAKLAMPAPPTINPTNSAVQQTALVHLSSARPTACTAHLPAQPTACTAHLPALPTTCAVHLPAQPTTCAVHLPARPTACAAHLPARPTACAVHLPARPTAYPVHLPARQTARAVHLPARPTACTAHLPAQPTTCAVHLPARPAAAHHMPTAFAQR